MVKKAYINRDFKSDKVFKVLWDDQLEEQMNCVVPMFHILNFVETFFILTQTLFHCFNTMSKKIKKHNKLVLSSRNTFNSIEKIISKC